MNSVHEPGPNGDSETIPSRKFRSKTKLGARAPKLAQLGTPSAPRVHQWPCRGRHSRPYRGRGPAVSWPRPWPCRSLSCRIVASLPRVPMRPAAPRRPASPCPSSSAHRPSPAPLPAPCRGRVCAQARPYRGLPCDTTQASSQYRLANCIAIHSSPQPASIAIHSCHDTLYGLVIQFLPRLQYNPTTCPLQYTAVYCNTIPALQAPLSCYTVSVLQYTLPTAHLRPLCCNTIAAH